MPIAKKVNKDFFKTWSPEMAYILGFFAADGYITVNSRGGQFWCIDITDRVLLEQIKKIIEAEHKISIRTREGGKHTSFRLQIGSMEMCDDLRKLGYNERKTKSLAVPNIPTAFLSHFARGYFDGDGHVWSGLIHKDRKTQTLCIQTVFTSCSKKFLIVLRDNLEKHDIFRGVVSKGNGNYYRLVYSIRSSLKLYDFMYNSIGTSKLFLERKKSVFERYLSAC